MSSVLKACEQFWEWRMAEFPEFSTFCGLKTFDDRLTDLSVSAHERRAVKYEHLLFLYILFM